MRKRIFAALVGLCMVLFFAPATALAGKMRLLRFMWAGRKLPGAAIGKQLLMENWKLVVEVTTMSTTTATAL